MFMMVTRPQQNTVVAKWRVLSGPNPTQRNRTKFHITELNEKKIF